MSINNINALNAFQKHPVDDMKEGPANRMLQAARNVINNQPVSGTSLQTRVKAYNSDSAATQGSDFASTQSEGNSDVVVIAVNRPLGIKHTVNKADMLKNIAIKTNRVNHKPKRAVVKKASNASVPPTPSKLWNWAAKGAENASLKTVTNNIEQLLSRNDQKYNINYQNRSGLNLLHKVVTSAKGTMENRTKIVEYLLGQGIDSTAKNNNKQTPKDLAISRRRTQLAELL